MIYLLIIYLASYILMEILWIYILEEDGFFIDGFVGLDNWCDQAMNFANVVILVGLPLLTIWGYFETLKEKVTNDVDN